MKQQSTRGAISDGLITAKVRSALAAVDLTGYPATFLPMEARTASGMPMSATTSIDSRGRLMDNLLLQIQILLSECEADFFEGQNNFSFKTAMKNGTTVNRTISRTKIPTATATADLKIGNSAKPMAENPMNTASPLISNVRPAVL